MKVKALIYLLRGVKKSTTNFRAGEHEVRIRISQFKEKEFIPLGYSSSVENWDEEYCLPKPSHPFYKSLLTKLYKYLHNIALVASSARKLGEYISCLDVKRKVLNKQRSPRQQNRLKILAFFDKIIADLENAGNPGYADVFYATRSTVSKLINSNEFSSSKKRSREKDKSFLAFTKEDHIRYEKLISCGNSYSTISYYLRTYYRIWNLAAKEGLCSKKDHHPSRFITFNPYKKIRTKKRAISQEFLQRILNIQLEPGSHIFHSQLLLRFMYYGRGINFGDVCKLQWHDVANDTIHYIRSKNHREYDYILHPAALSVIGYFKHYFIQSNAGYIFPFLFSVHNSARKIKNRIVCLLQDFNTDLKKMAQMVGWERQFTSNAIRHSFATHLRNNGVTLSIIQEALGHEHEQQTAVYLDDLDDKFVADEIARALNFTLKNEENIK